MRDFQKKAARLVIALYAALSFNAPSGAADSTPASIGTGSADLSGDAAIYGLEGAFSDDIYVKISLSGYRVSDGALQIEGLISKMASYVSYVMDDSPTDLSLRFPASLLNDLPGGVHDITASSWDFQRRSVVTIPHTTVGRLFIKTATPGAAIDYVTEKLTNLRQNDGIPYRRDTRRQACYAFKWGNETVIGAPDFRNTFPIPEERMTGESVTIIHLNATESLNSEPQTVRIPKRPKAPWWVFALDETSPGSCDGMILGVSEAMEYSTDGGIYWTDCPTWKIEGLNPSAHYRVRFKAAEGVSFASRQRKLAINAAAEEAAP
ncbi:MAG: hypothetical protein LBL73_11660 [Synergistaceae bacterium]|jgi:hypothetical protein|nr:hypothetical protein [Synergistaceae bacterium]